MDSYSHKDKIEIERIKGAYARRKESSLYSCFNPGHLFTVQGCERRVLGLLERYGLINLEGRMILEIGCGTGYWLRELIKWGANPKHVTGIDLLPDRIAVARRLCPEGMNLITGNAAQLEFEDSSFDLVLQFTVFTSILDSSWRQKVAAEMLRVVSPHGLIVWYDYHFNNPYNPDVRGVKRHEMYKLFPKSTIDSCSITLAPQLARLIAPYSWILCGILEQFKIFNTHYLAVIKP